MTKKLTKAERDDLKARLLARNEGIGVKPSRTTQADIGGDPRKQWAYNFALQRIEPALRPVAKQSSEANTTFYLAAPGAVVQTVSCWLAGKMFYNGITPIDDNALTALDYEMADAHIAKLNAEQAVIDEAREAAHAAKVAEANAILAE